MTRSGSRSRAWVAYAVAAAGVTALVAGGALVLTDSAGRAIAAGAGLALGVQLVAFGLLLAVRDQAHLFLAGWLGGMVVRFGAVGACVYLGPRPMVLSLVGVVFVLLMLEPVFLRWDLRRP